MRPLLEMSDAVARSISVLFVDIDDTMTTDGRLIAEAYSALQRLHDAGLKVAPITGRPAGWCDMIARFWPVDGVVGENGAFYFSYDHRAKRMRRQFAATEFERIQNRASLEQVRDRILNAVSGSAVSGDQSYREADLAIDFCEDVAPLDGPAIDQIVAMFEDAGAVAKVSSIHVNGWFGDYDKLTTTRKFSADILGIDLDREKENIVFVGDSPNDAPMFRFFPHACGVANVLRFEDRLEAEPAYVSQAEGGAGFVEITDRILAARSAQGSCR